MTNLDPEIRAAQSQSLLATVKRLPSRSERDAIIERTGAAAIEAISGTLPLAWVSMTHHMGLSCAVRDELGAARNIELWRRTMEYSFQRPYLRGFVSMTTSLLGVRPASLLKRGGSLYEHITRNVGTLRYEPGSDNDGEARLTQFPAKRYDFGCYVEGLAGCIEATLTICNTRGSVEVLDRDDMRGDARYRVSWL